MEHVDEIEFYWPPSEDTYLVEAGVTYTLGPYDSEGCPTAGTTTVEVLAVYLEGEGAGNGKLTPGEQALLLLQQGQAIKTHAAELSLDRACSREEQAYEARDER